MNGMRVCLIALPFKGVRHILSLSSRLSPGHRSFIYPCVQPCASSTVSVVREGVSRLVIALALVDKRLWSSILLTVLCMVGYWLNLMFGADQPWWMCFVYHFDHANVFHLALNLWALYQFKPRWKTCAVAYAVSSVAALLPFSSVALPTCGLSGLLMAAYARQYAEFRLPIWKPIAVNMVFALLPMFNWKIHLVSFLISYLVWYRKRK